MGRSGWRVILENGFKLDINRYAKRGYVRPGSVSGPIGISWSNSYWGHLRSAVLRVDMSGPIEGSFRILLGELDQRIMLRRRSRHFGGGQWYFICPVTNRCASVLWKPPGAHRFCSRQTWGRQVAYHSQFLSPTDRAWHGKSKINRRLCEAGDLEPEDWDFPPKPKWMRWRTYQGLEERFDGHEAELDRGCEALLARLLGKKLFNINAGGRVAQEISNSETRASVRVMVAKLISRECCVDLGQANDRRHSTPICRWLRD
jgi:hypothetical protein